MLQRKKDLWKFKADENDANATYEKLQQQNQTKFLEIKQLKTELQNLKNKKLAASDNKADREAAKKSEDLLKKQEEAAKLEA